MWCSSVELIARNGVPWDDAIVVLAGNLRKLWDSLSELRSSVCERRLERQLWGLRYCMFLSWMSFVRTAWNERVIRMFTFEQCIPVEQTGTPETKTNVSTYQLPEAYSTSNNTSTPYIPICTQERPTTGNIKDSGNHGHWNNTRTPPPPKLRTDGE
jgi:hypothetical protein